MTTPAINPNLTATTYGQIRPGDRVVNGFLTAPVALRVSNSLT